MYPMFRYPSPLTILISPDHPGPWNGSAHSSELTSNVGQPRMVYPLGASQAWGSGRRPDRRQRGTSG